MDVGAPPSTNEMPAKEPASAGATDHPVVSVSGDGGASTPQAEKAVGHSVRREDDTRRKLSPHLVEELDELRGCVQKHGKYKRLVGEDKADLDKAYERYQKKVLKIACTNLLNMESVLNYLGLGNRARLVQQGSEEDSK